MAVTASQAFVLRSFGTAAGSGMLGAGEHFQASKRPLCCNGKIEYGLRLLQ